jgi:HDOD domain
MELTSVAAKEDVDARTIADMLKQDPALSAHVLRIVNSPLYSPRAQIVSLQQAVARVGIGKIREIAGRAGFRRFRLRGRRGTFFDEADHVTDRRGLPLLDQDAREHTVGRRGKIDRHFCRFRF